MDAFPAFLPLAGATVVVAGEGAAADAKARLFDGSPARLVRLDGPQAVTAERCVGARLVFIAGDDPAACAAAAVRARAAGALVNVVDRPELGDFATPSIIDRGAVVGAVGTGGAAPVLAVRLRQEFEARWPARLGEVAHLLQRLRRPAATRLDSMDARRRFYTRVLDGAPARFALAGEPDAALAAAEALFDEVAAPVGSVAVIAIPAEPDLLSLRAARRLGAADVLFADEAAPLGLLALARRDAPRAAPDDRRIMQAIAAGQTAAVLVVDADPWVRRLGVDGVVIERLG